MLIKYRPDLLTRGGDWTVVAKIIITIVRNYIENPIIKHDYSLI